MTATWVGSVRSLFPGILASTIVAIAAVFLNECYGAPAMLFALLLGLPFKFLSDEGPCGPAIATITAGQRMRMFTFPVLVSLLHTADGDRESIAVIGFQTGLIEDA